MCVLQNVKCCDATNATCLKLVKSICVKSDLTEIDVKANYGDQTENESSNASKCIQFSQTPVTCLQIYLIHIVFYLHIPVLISASYLYRQQMYKSLNCYKND